MRELTGFFDPRICLSANGGPSIGRLNTYRQIHCKKEFRQYLSLMQRFNKHHNGIKLLSAFWLVVALQFGVAAPTSAVDKAPETFQKLESAGKAFIFDYLLEESTSPDLQKCLYPYYIHYAQVDFNLLGVFELPPGDWPDESRIKSWFNIVAYQYYLSALSLAS